MRKVVVQVGNLDLYMKELDSQCGSCKLGCDKYKSSYELRHPDDIDEHKGQIFRTPSSYECSLKKLKFMISLEASRVLLLSNSD